VEYGQAIFDITPLRKTTAPSSVTFAAVNGDATLTVTNVAHGAVLGDFVTFVGAVTLGGTITAVVLNHEYRIATIADANTFTVEAEDAAGVTVLANGADVGDGLGTTYAEFQINTGTNSYLGSAGWSTGTYSSGVWGGGEDLTFSGQLRLYSQDAFADDLIFNPRLGGIFFWDESVGTGTRAVNLVDIVGASNPPTVAMQVMVSPQDRHVIVFGCNSLGLTALDPLLVRWSDQESVIDWTPTAINTAGGQVLSTGTKIIGAVKTRQEILIFTDTSVHAMRFAGAPFVYQFVPIAENVTILSPKAAVSAGDAVYFMDREGFYMYQGSVRRLTCSVLNYVYSNIDTSQLFKVHATNNPDDSEVTWYYPVGTNADITNYVTYNYMEDLWMVGTMERGAWIQAPTRTFPIASSNDVVNVETNYLYNQEYLYDAEGANLGAYVESGDLEIGDGDALSFLSRIISDFRIRGVENSADFTVQILGRDYPQDDLVSRSSSTVLATTKQSHVRVRAREVVLRIDANNAGYGWTMGDFRFDLRTDGRRG
jgi:hypothetical protein